MFWIVIVGIVLFLYNFLLKPQKTWIKRGVKQAGTTPLIGDSLGTFLRTESFADMFKRIYNTYPNERYVGFHQMTKPGLMLRDPDLIKQMTVKDFDHFTDHLNFVNSKSDPLWQRNLFALKGEEWHEMRSSVSPVFTGSKMRSMFFLMNDCAKQLTSFLLNKNEEEIELEMQNILTRYTNDVIATCAFGVTVDSLKDPENEFYMRGKEATNLRDFKRNFKIFLGFLSPKFSDLLKVRIFDEAISNFFIKLISDSIEIRENKNIVRPDLIQLLIDAKKGKLKHEETADIKDSGFATVEESHIGKVQKIDNRTITDIDITAQALIFFFAGFHTVAAAMSFFVYELATNPDIQDRLIEEVDKTMKDCKGEVTFDTIAKMKYMDMVMSEVLRKWLPAVTADRICTKPYTIQPVNPDEKPLYINVDEMIILPVIGLHYDPRYYENPETFDPERFADENKHNINPYTYLPFGVGPRNCIGSRFALMEIKTVIFHILSKFKFVPSKKSVIPLKIDKGQFTLVPENGLWMGIKKR